MSPNERNFLLELYLFGKKIITSDKIKIAESLSQKGYILMRSNVGVHAFFTKAGKARVQEALQAFDDQIKPTANLEK
ncbi:MAG: hypothetical protein F6K11_34665 [Leptolyngbya sp. SIO3F4]|nr:hypothetical protein [Leptolyngbya sp. SIO3F4]